MQKLLTVNLPAYKDPQEFQTYLKAQLDLSLSMGWDKGQILIVTNSEDIAQVCEGYNTHITPLNDFCLTGSKQFGLFYAYTNNLIKELTWVHDLDIWQNTPFPAPEVKDWAISTYGSDSFNGGSLFVRPSAQDMNNTIVQQLLLHKPKREEPTLNAILRSDLYASRVTTLGHTYNVGCSGFAYRYTVSDKPILCHHFHPHMQENWDIHARNKTGVGPSACIGPVLRETLVNHFGETIKDFVYADGLSPFETRA
jgi:hypothetical protein